MGVGVRTTNEGAKQVIHLGRLRLIARLPRRRATVIAATSAVAIGGIALFLPLSPARGDTITASATADTYTRENAATSNFGMLARWSVDGRKSDVRHALLTFDVNIPAGQTIASATLRAHSESASTGTGVDAYTIAETWTETGVAWNTEPEYGNRLSNSGGYPDESWVEWDVTAGVTKGGPVSLLLSTGEPSWLGFDSRENDSGLAPQLVVTTAATPTAIYHRDTYTHVLTDTDTNRRGHHVGGGR
jgi:hypothetical protein